MPVLVSGLQQALFKIGNTGLVHSFKRSKLGAALLFEQCELFCIQAC